LAANRRSTTFPNRETEVQLAQMWGKVAGMDEVGRGALAGPVCVGVAVATEEMGQVPKHLADSKLISASRRMALVAPIKEWVVDWAVGAASPVEIDRLGLTSALRLAGQRALAQVCDVGGVLLDGKHDWLSSGDLFDAGVKVPVVTQVKADEKCSIVAAASVIAKVHRDRLMETLSDPGYHWASNKGYGSAEHKRALREIGISDQHRKSWKLV